MDKSSGFYKNDNGNLLFATNSVTGPDFDLNRLDYSSYDYPVDGWSWFESEEDARLALGFPTRLEEAFNAMTDEDKRKLLGMG